jgi:hypothetical protein
MSGPDLTFPSPWFPATKIGDYEVVPIDNSAALYREGAAMHHCVGTYAGAVRGGTLYIYSVRRDGERVATLALARSAVSAALSQIRGPCNTQPDKRIVAAVRRWLRAQAALPRSEFNHDPDLDHAKLGGRTTDPHKLTPAAADLTPRFDEAGRFIHLCCECGRDAHVGFGVNLRVGQLGRWFCATCKPPAHEAHDGA